MIDKLLRDMAEAIKSAKPIGATITFEEAAQAALRIVADAIPDDNGTDDFLLIEFRDAIKQWGKQ